MNKLIILTLTLLWGVSIPTMAQIADKQRPNLSALLKELAASGAVQCSFSPTLTDHVYPKNTNINGEVETVLKRILAGTGLSYKFIREDYVYISKCPQPQPAIAKSPLNEAPPAEEPKVDTSNFHVVTLDIKTLENIAQQFPIPEIKLSKLSSLPSVIPQLQKTKSSLSAVWAVKTNLLYDATSTINLGTEIGLGRRTTLDLSGNYNSWTFSDNRKMKHWLVQPEFRLWTCSRFSGGFWGIHAHYAQYNMGGMLPWGFRSGKMFGSIKNDNILNHRYEGWLVGGGIGYGYHWILGRRWGLEAEIGVGYAYLEYDKFRCETCGEKLGRESKHYFGPTKAAITLIFMIK